MVLQNQALDRFVAEGGEYCRAKYTEIAIQHEICLSKEALLWKRLKEVMGHVQANRPAEALQVAKTAMGLRSDYDRALARWIHMYADEVKKQQTSVSDEMRILGNQVKEQARLLIEKDNREEARTVLLQLRALLPYDEEVMEMLNQVQ